MVAMLQNTVAQSNWQAAAMQQTPKRLWAHRYELTEYQYLDYLPMDTEDRVVHQQEEITMEGSVQEFWTTGQRQLKAIAQRERRRPDKLGNGTRLLLCQYSLERQPIATVPTKTNQVQPPIPKTEPELLARLRINQTASRR
ncbi:RxLR effector candidate protein [Phytophthora palmivora]|uniref:RxLR effector candidate protein n=1 Tax=Phytophthora palmivora TaxID=4796 RepID=A0A2P4YCQ0_9STRA|nr:RxLR effector candidate protein [Phytophthora palmivora]